MSEVVCESVKVDVAGATPAQERSFLSPKFYRQGTITTRKIINFAFTQGDLGLGDQVCYMAAIKYIAENNPQVNGRVYCVEWFVPIAENVLFPWLTQNGGKWKVQHREALTEQKLKSRLTLAPTTFPISRIGSHAVDLGFIYFMQTNPAPESGNFYPELDLSKVDISHYNLPESYVVFSPGATNQPKRWPAVGVNRTAKHCLSKGITPVFLGSRDFRPQIPTLIDKDYDFSVGIDLMDQTTLLEAAKIMAGAKVVVGIDNGLMHLAAMTEAPIVLGYTVSSPDHTKPRRRKGVIHNIYPEPEQLPCIFCQSNMRMMFSHDFKNCLYKDNLCTVALGDTDGWNRLIDKVLSTPV